MLQVPWLPAVAWHWQVQQGAHLNQRSSTSGELVFVAALRAAGAPLAAAHVTSSAGKEGYDPLSAIKVKEAMGLGPEEVAALLVSRASLCVLFEPKAASD